MKILLHICCAPCLIHPLQELIKKREDSITGFFYNPNIHPFTEMKKRRQALVDYTLKEKLEVVFDEYDMENFFENIGNNFTAPSRCRICWEMRLERCAQYAKKNGFDAFATTLLVSPYQNRQEIVRIGSALADKFGIRFLDSDWRGGFRPAQQSAREQNMYRQKYCGCIFSEKERFTREKSL